MVVVVAVAVGLDEQGRRPLARTNPARVHRRTDGRWYRRPRHAWAAPASGRRRVPGRACLHRGAASQGVHRAARRGRALGLEAAGGLARVPGAELAPRNGRALAGPPARCRPTAAHPASRHGGGTSAGRGSFGIAVQGSVFHVICAGRIEGKGRVVGWEGVLCNRPLVAVLQCGWEGVLCNRPLVAVLPYGRGIPGVAVVNVQPSRSDVDAAAAFVAGACSRSRTRLSSSGVAIINVQRIPTRTAVACCGGRCFGEGRERSGIR